MAKMTQKLGLLALAGLTLGATACGSDIDSNTARQAISSNTQNVSQQLVNSMGFLEESQLLTHGLEDISGDCVVEAGSGADFDTGECGTSFEIDSQQMSEATDQLAQILETRIFTDANIESEDGDEITFLMRGNVLCDEGDGVDPECAQAVNDAQIRLVVSSPAEGDVDIDVLVGPARHQPLALEFHQDHLAATVELAAVKGSIEHLALLEGETPDLPATMEGAVRAELAVSGSDRVTATLSVVRAISLANDDWALAMGAASPALQVTANAAQKKLEAIVNIARVTGAFPTEEWEYDSATGEETQTTHRVAFDLGGLTGQTVLDATTDELVLTSLSLGQTTSTIGVDGKNVLAVDINSDANREFNAILRAAGDEFELEISPSFDLDAVLAFINAPDEADAWALDEILSIDATGTDGAKFRAHEDGVEVLEGQLNIDLQNADIHLSAAAGQCLLGEISGSSQESCSVDDTMCGTEPGEEVNPWEGLSTGACPN